MTSLDPAWLAAFRRDLNAADRAVRLAAVRQAARDGVGAETVTALQVYLHREADPECLAEGRRVMALVETRTRLIEAEPQRLLAELPVALRHDDPRVRALAVRVLGRLDEVEALRYLEAMLLDVDPQVRRAGLENCLLQPFPRVKGMLLTFVAREAEPALLDDVAAVFMTNPDLEVPYRLWEVAERSEPGKARRLQELVKDVCGTIRQAGLLTEAFPEFVGRLRQWARQRAVTRWVHDVLGRLDSDGWGADAEFVAVVKKNLNQPEVRAALQQALERWPLNERQRCGATSLLAPAAATAPALATEMFVTFAICEPADADRVAPLVAQILAQVDAADTVRAAALKGALRMNLDAHRALAVRWLTQAQPVLTSAAIEYLERFDIDAVIPHLGRLLAAGDERVRRAALRALQKQDAQQAVATLVNMLGSRRREVRDEAMAGMVRFEFALVRQALSRYLEKCEDLAGFRTGLCLFEANPDVENLYTLYVVERQRDGEYAALARATRLQCQATLEQYNWLQVRPGEQIEQEYATRWANELARRRGPTPAYAFRPRGVPGTVSLVERLRYGSPWVAAAAAVAVLYGWSLWWAVDAPAMRSTEQAGAMRQVVSGEFSGKIETLLWRSGQAVFLAEDGQRYVLAFEEFSGRKPRVGERWQIRLYPFRMTGDGLLAAKIEKATMLR